MLLDDASRLVHLGDEVTAFRECLDGDLSAPITACPGWDVAALATHLGRVHRWATAALRSDAEPAFPPRPGAVPLVTWYDEGAGALLGELAGRDPAQPCWTLWPPAEVGFWTRRQALETLVHRWDAQTALGRPTAIDPDLAADGVAEVVDVMLPRQVALGRQPALAVALELRDGDRSLVLGTGERAVLAAPAADLLLLLWKRRTLAEVLDAGGVLSGPRTVADTVLAAALTP